MPIRQITGVQNTASQFLLKSRISPLFKGDCLARQPSTAEGKPVFQHTQNDVKSPAKPRKLFVESSVLDSGVAKS